MLRRAWGVVGYGQRGFQGTKGKARGVTSSQVLGSGSLASFQRCQKRSSACCARSASSTQAESSPLLEILDQARLWLTDLVGGRTVTVYWDKRDRYGRVVGKVVAEGRDVGLAMVREGYAWWYRKYADEQSAVDQVLYGAAELATREGNRGLWRDPEPMAPWDYRC